MARAWAELQRGPGGAWLRVASESGGAPLPLRTKPRLELDDGSEVAVDACDWERRGAGVEAAAAGAGEGRNKAARAARQQGDGPHGEQRRRQEERVARQRGGAPDGAHSQPAPPSEVAAAVAAAGPAWPAAAPAAAEPMAIDADGHGAAGGLRGRPACAPAAGPRPGQAPPPPQQQRQQQGGGGTAQQGGGERRRGEQPNSSGGGAGAGSSGDDPPSEGGGGEGLDEEEEEELGQEGEEQAGPDYDTQARAEGGSTCHPLLAGTVFVFCFFWGGAVPCCLTPAPAA